MTCESCRQRPPRETLNHNGRALHVCRPCARIIRIKRQAK